MNGIARDDYSGHSVSSEGDVNGDGIDDIIIAAFGADPSGNSRAGETYVVFGGTSVGASGSIELAALDDTNGFIMNGIEQSDRIGFSVSSAGDVNGDSIDDLIVGVFLADANGIYRPGKTYVIFGSATLGQSIPQDLSANGCIDSVDLAMLLQVWATSDADLNADGITDSTDLAILLATWTG